MKYNNNKHDFRSYKEFVQHNERVQKANKRKRLQAITFGNIATKKRFIEAENERKKIYRRNSAKIISRLFNNILVNFHGTFIQKARQEITIQTSVSKITLVNSNTRKYGIDKTFKNSCWKLKQDNLELSMQDIVKEQREISNYLNKIYKRVRESKNINSLPTQLKPSELKHNSINEFLYNWENNEVIKTSTFTPNLKKLNDILDSQGNNHEVEIKESIIGKESKIIEKQKTKSKKSLPNANDFTFINPDGTLKKFKTINQTKKRFLK